MKRVALVALAGCSAGHPPETAAAARDVATFITPDVVGVLRGSSAEFPILAYVSSLLPTPPACWTKLRTAISAGYQFELKGGGTYFVFDGDLPRADVETCIEDALAATPAAVQLTHDGELDAFDAGRAGTAYVAWRGSIVIAGTKPRVTAALGSSSPELGHTWRDRLAQLPAGPMGMWRSDELVHNLIGVPTTSYELVFDHMSKTPTPSFAGRLVIQYATAADATTAARKLHAGELEPRIDAPPELVAAFTRMIVSQASTTVEAKFDLDTFAGLDLGLLQGWLAKLAVARAP